MSRKSSLPSLPRHLMAASMALALGVWGGPGLAQTAPAAAVAKVHQLNLPAGTLTQALIALAQQTSTQILYHGQLTSGKQAAALQGAFTLDDALHRLLAGSGLAASWEGGVAVIKPAASGGAPKTLGAVTVTAQTDSGSVTEGSGSYVMRGASSTATGLNLTLRETPQSVSVITQQQMRDSNMQSLDDVAAATPGVSYDKLGTERSTFYSRGFPITDIQLDGMSNSVAESYSADAMSFNNMAIYDRVEVVRGANGLLQGSGNPSAVINLVRKRPTRDFQLSAELGAGAWHDYRAQLDASGPLNQDGSVRGRVVLFDNQADSYANGASTDNQLLYAIGEADLGANTTVSFGLSAQKDNHGAYNWGGLNTKPDGSFYDLASTVAMAAPWTHLNRDNYTAFAELTHRFSNGWNVTGALNAARSDASFLAFYPSRVSGSVFNLATVDAEYQDRQLALNLKASGPFTLFGRQHQLMLSASSRKDNFDYDIYNATSTPQIDLTNFDFAAIPMPGLSAKPSLSKLERTEKGAVLATRLSATDALSVILGSRISWSRYSALSPYSNSSYDSGRQFIPYAGAIYDLSRQHALYVSYTGIYSIQQYYSPSGLLAPVKGKNHEAGIKSEWFDKKLNTALALFQTDQLNLPVQLNVASTCGLSGATRCYTEGAKVRNRGVDAEVSGSPLEGWNIAAGYTFSNPEYIAGPNNGKGYNTNLPRRLFKLSTDYRLPGGRWHVGGNVQSQSQMHYDGGTFYIHQGGYSLLNLHSGYQISDHLHLQLNLRNVLDKQYYQSVPTNNNYGGVFAGTPRSFAITLRYDH